MIPTLDDAVVVALDTRASNMRGSPGFLSARSYLEHLRFEVEDIVVVVGRGGGGNAEGPCQSWPACH
jgi:hypothetical protein